MIWGRQHKANRTRRHPAIVWGATIAALLLSTIGQDGELVVAWSPPELRVAVAVAGTGNGVATVVDEHGWGGAKREVGR